MESTFLSVIEQFERQVQSTPTAPAVVFEDSELTFLQLDELANRFAHAMREAGVSRGHTVGLCVDRRPEAIASMLGAFKIGAVYVPLDPEYPADRVRYMIEDADVHVVVTHGLKTNALASALCDLLEKDEAQVRTLRWIDSAGDAFLQMPITPVHDLPSANELAYIMYTSGSTGMPKGVQIEHLALSVYCDADREVYELTSDDRTLQFSTLNFDIAIEEIFPPLLSGGVVVIRPQSRSASHNELSSIIDRYGVTAIHIATAYWHEWVDLMVAAKTPVPGSLRLVIATGEKVSVEHYRRWMSLCRQPIKWCNAYGPTETTVTATVFIPDHNFDEDHMPIGKPLAGYEAFILDDANRPLGIGETGQLFIGGAALARGYHNHPAKTNAAFLTVDLPNRGPTRIYRTGDLARWLSSGDIEFAGRVDHQIKVGSYRIEPGEIEVAVAKFPGVLESIVVHEEVAGQKFLIAYVATGSNPVEPRSLQDYLKTVLPTYMVPPRYLFLAALPKTINGKIDRRSLPSASTSVPVADDNFAAPQTELQRKLADIWQRVLHYPSIGVHDDFFSLGGSSLLVTRVVTALAADLEIELPVRDFFANPTIASSAEHIERLISSKNGDTQPDTRSNIASAEARSRLPILHPEFVDVKDGCVFTVRYEPRKASRRHAVLICNAIVHEQVRAYRNLQQLAIQLADHGFDVVRFDYRGTGNSTGACEACMEQSFKADTRAAATYLRQQTNADRLSVIGIRLGATIASLAAIEDVDQMILWDPVVHGRDFVNMLDRFHDLTLRNQTRFVKVMKRRGRDQAYGHGLGPQKRQSLSAMQLPTNPTRLGKRSIILTSYGYQQQERGFDALSSDWNITSVDDHIAWHQPEYAERAFSSPASYPAIISSLNGENDEPIQTSPLILASSQWNTPIVGELVS
jgi:amino acid adenylation domain-containing protein